MSAILLSAEALAPRALRHHRPPAGTASRILRLRLQRSFSCGPGTSSRRAPLAQAEARSRYDLPNGVVKPRVQPQPGFGLSSGEIEALRKILAQEAQTPETPAPDMPVRVSPAAEEEQDRAVGRAAHDLSEIMQEASTRRLYVWLANADSEVQRVVADLPSTTFSEFLRLLDPFSVSETVDPSHGMAIRPGLAQYTELGQYIDQFGVRLIHRFLLGRLTAVYQLRLEAGHRMLLNDYLVLMRCAGAASDIPMATRFWHDMVGAGMENWRHSEAYREFIKARFLTDPLYAQQDPTRFRLRAEDLHKQKRLLNRQKISQLRGLRIRMESNAKYRFGQNTHELKYAEHLTRILRKTKPLRKVFAMTGVLGLTPDLPLLCAVLTALGRNGSLKEIDRILERVWKVWTRVDKETGVVTVGGGDVLGTDSALRPSPVLLDAVVQAYCCNGEVSRALKMVDFISRRYKVTVPDRVWFELLSWSYVMSSRPVTTEWRIAGFPEKTLGGGAVELVWRTMTSEPYNVEPGIVQYDVFVKSLIARRKYTEAIEVIRRARTFYEQQLRAHEAAMLEFSHATTQGVSPGSTVKRAKEAALAKGHIWYCFQVWFWTMFKKVRPRDINHDFTARTIPGLVDEFRSFMPDLIQYRIPTGYVHIKEPAPHQRTVMTRPVIEMPGLRGEAGVKLSAEHGGPAEDDGQEGDMVAEGVTRRRRPHRLRPRRVTLRRPVIWTPNLGNLNDTAPKGWLLREFT